MTPLSRGADDPAGPGYLHPGYAASLSEFGAARELRAAGGWFLQRAIPGSGLSDGTGCYPLFACRDWSALGNDVDALEGDLVSLAVVADPFGEDDPERLRRVFPDLVLPFKRHFVVDLRMPPGRFVAEHHARYARKALREVTVERCADPPSLLDEWAGLYDVLVERHRIRGIPRFSRASFAKQLAVPGLVAFRALHGGLPVGMTLWYTYEGRGYYHLGAYSPLGYSSRASFALFWRALEHFADELSWLDLGGGAGVANDGADGLSRFKKGWSTGSRTAHFCGRILDRARYETLSAGARREPPGYFPAYRAGEFG